MEIWKTIPDTNNGYKISISGKVYSNISKKEMTLRLRSNNLTARLRIRKNKAKDYRIDKLVYELFNNKKITEYQRIYHINNNVYNNKLENLAVRNLNINFIGSHKQDNEIWKEIPETNNGYKISNYGEIYSNITKRKMTLRLRSTGLTVPLRVGKNKVKSYRINKLVYELFNEKKITEYQYIYHIDNNVYNNKLENLVVRNLNINSTGSLKKDDEIWKEIPGTNNRYKISNYGGVYSNITKIGMSLHARNNKLIVNLKTRKNIVWTILINILNTRISIWIYRIYLWIILDQYLTLLLMIILC